MSRPDKQHAAGPRISIRFTSAGLDYRRRFTSDLPVRRMAKKLKSAAEIAEFIRQAIKEPELRAAVYSGPHGWNAKAYAAPHVAIETQRKVNTVSRGLQMLYELQS